MDTRGRSALTALTAAACVLASATTAQAGIWSEVSSNTTETITAIDYQSDSRMWFTTANGRIFRRNPDGTFSQNATGPGFASTVLSDVAFQPGGNVGYAVGSGDNLWRSTDGGANWTKLTTATPNYSCDQPGAPAGTTAVTNLSAVAWADANTVYVVGEGKPTDTPSVLKSTNAATGGAPTFTEVGKAIDGGGTGRCRVRSAPLTDLFFINATTGWIHTDNFGQMSFTSDGLVSNAANREAGTNGFDKPGRLAGDPANPNRQWTVRSYGSGGSYTTFTEDAWGTWDYIDADDGNGTNTAMYDVAYAGGTVLMAGDAGQIFNSVDGRKFHLARADGDLATRDWRAVDLASGTQGAVGGTGGKLVMTTRANEIPPPPTPPTTTTTTPTPAPAPPRRPVSAPAPLTRTTTASVPGATVQLRVPGCIRAGVPFVVRLTWKKARRKGNRFVRVRRADFYIGTRRQKIDRRAPFTQRLVIARPIAGQVYRIRARAFIKVRRGRSPTKSIIATVRVCT